MSGVNDDDTVISVGDVLLLAVASAPQLLIQIFSFDTIGIFSCIESFLLMALKWPP